MKMKIHILKLALLLIIASFSLASQDIYASEQARETIVYEISPLGASIYQDMGLVDFRGQTANLTIFKTEVAGFKDTEKIYSDTNTYLPLWVERDLLMWFNNKEYLTEEYVAWENRLTITKFKQGKKVQEYKFKGKGPIHNAILVPFSLRKIPNLEIGWTYNIRLPDEFKVKLVSVEDVVVPAGKFKAYHFSSTPHKFEIWITTDKLRLPVKIQGIGFSYTLMMKQYSVQKEGK